MVMYTYIGGADKLNQASTITIGSSTNGHIFNILLAHPSGRGTAVQIATYTAGGAETTTTIAAALYALLAASKHRYALAVTFGANQANVIPVTAKRAGEAFVLTASGTGTTTIAATTVNSGPEDYACTGNWLGGAIPTAAGDVTLAGDQYGRISIKYGLDQSAVAIEEMLITARTGQIGWPEYCLKVDPDRLRIDTGALVYLDIHSAAISPRVDRTHPGLGPGLPGCYLIGSAMATVNIEPGANVGIGHHAGESATATTIQNRGSCHVGLNVTLTNFKQSLDSSYGCLRNGNNMTLVECIDGHLDEYLTGSAASMVLAAGDHWLNGSGNFTSVTLLGGNQHTRQNRNARNFGAVAKYKAANFDRDTSAAAVITATVTEPDGLAPSPGVRGWYDATGSR